MNGLSFEEFENSSFDSLYNRNFAGAKSMDEASQGFREQATRALQAQAANQGQLQYSRGAPQPLGHGGTYMPQASTSKGIATRALPGYDSAASGASTYFQSPGTSAPTRATQTVVPAMPMSLNDMGTMPGNARVDHEWRPSREAHNRAGHLALAGTSAPTQALPRPSGGGDKGTFIGWKSN
mmetsp:Transcript_76339/g.181536  ORF Transcript_76339/g.181536 Transcript_76339/m.181536 type:complete len:181 (-) Transcript_76339:98-640(-)